MRKLFILILFVGIFGINNCVGNSCCRNEDDDKSNKLKLGIGSKNIKNRKSEKSDPIWYECVEESGDCKASDADSPKGLVNFMLNCYMNSLVQCLYSLDKFRDEIIQNKDNYARNNKNQVSRVLSEIFFDLMYSNEKTVSAKKLKEVMGEKNSLFKGRKGADDADLLLNVISCLTDELKNDGNIENCEDPDSTNFKECFDYELKTTDKECIINKNFYFNCFNKIPCNSEKSKDKHFCYVIDGSYFCLFYLNNFQKSYEKKDFTLYECFNYDFNVKKIAVATCSKCGENIENECCKKFCSTPEVLIIILNRGKGKTFTGKVDFDKTIDIKSYCESSVVDKTKYKLAGVSVHIGKSDPFEGHYAAYCVRNNKWYYFSDSIVKEKGEDFAMNKIEGDPCLLFYQKIN